MTKKVVIKLEVNGKRPASIAKKMGVGMLKVMMPLECIREKFEDTPSQNKSKAMQIAVEFPGVTATSLEGENREELVVKGEGFDAVELVRKLREKVGGAHIKSVGQEEEKKVEEKKPEVENEKKPTVTYVQSYPPQPYVQVLELPDYGAPRWLFNRY